MKFKVGDRVRYRGINTDEIIEQINSEGEIRGRYCSGNEAGRLGVWAGSSFYTLAIGGSMSRYEELKKRIDMLSNGWDKEADDILQEIDMARIMEITCYNERCGYLAILKAGNTSGKREIQFDFNSQCEKLTAFKNALLYLLEKSDIKKDLVGQEVKADIEGKVYKVKVIEEA